MPQWDPNQYLQFISQRTQPCIDLVARINLDEVNDVVDLGCGPGNSTEVLAKKFPRATIVGFDNSPDMIAQAKKDYPQFTFAPGDAATWTANRKCDVILANAVFQWVAHHESLLPRLVQQLRHRGVLAVQMPRNFESPTHTVLREIASRPQWDQKVRTRDLHWAQPPDFYFDLLSPITSKLEIWETEYIHIMPDHDAIVQWYKGTGLRPYLEPLSSDDQEKFIAEYKDEIAKQYPPQKTGQVLFPFRRIFFLAYNA